MAISQLIYPHPLLTGRWSGISPANLLSLRELSQKGQFASKETVSLFGNKGFIKNVRILGPLREETQIEISTTDAYFGNVWTTQKEKGMENLKLLIVRPIGHDNEFIEDILVAVDRIGAGISETVLITKGSPAQKICGDQNTPIDAAIVGIVDSYDIA